ncbi:PREDICTED: uncharacterized protein LOC107174201 [Diuraphis noxia]|uniref:uncharacterized protein LOC107174201 n=1 Tax=Diuraphis noxia TaxID=143948 RepID=UPI0007639E4E|nr:PREDICTED: uncharacterized protein LOC107174201 [Diuraphis noxia]
MKVSSSSGRVCGGGGGGGGGVCGNGGGDGNDAGNRGDSGGGCGGGAPNNNNSSSTSTSTSTSTSSPPCSEGGGGGGGGGGGSGGLVAGVLVSDQGEVISDRYVGVARQFVSRQASERGSTKADQSDGNDDETTLRQMLVSLQHQVTDMSANLTTRLDELQSRGVSPSPAAAYYGTEHRGHVETSVALSEIRSQLHELTRSLETCQSEVTEVKRDMVAIKNELDTVQQVKEEIEELREYVDRLELQSHRRKLRLLEQCSSFSNAFNCRTRSYKFDYCLEKGGLLLNSFVGIGGACLMGLTKYFNSYEVLFIGRFIIGVNCGLNTSLVPMYISEIAPLNLRGGLGTVNQLAVTTGLLISQILGIEQILGTDEGWPLLLGLAICPAILQLILLPVCPESPRYLLITKQWEEEARKVKIEFFGFVQEMIDWMSYLAVVSILGFVVFFAVGPGSIPWMITAELFSQGPRPAAMSIAVLINWVANFAVGIGFQPLKTALDNYTFLPFSVLLAIFWIFTYKKVPETKNKTFEEILALFRQNGRGSVLESSRLYGSMLNYSNALDEHLPPSERASLMVAEEKPLPDSCKLNRFFFLYIFIYIHFSYILIFGENLYKTILVVLL